MVLEINLVTPFYLSIRLIIYRESFIIKINKLIKNLRNRAAGN